MLDQEEFIAFFNKQGWKPLKLYLFAFSFILNQSI